MLISTLAFLMALLVAQSRVEAGIHSLVETVAAGAVLGHLRRDRRSSRSGAEGVAYRSGLVALAGRPNVGKSTLANALAGSQVAAVSPRPQTTRRRITAVAHGDGWQAVLLDLPGFQRPPTG